MLILGLFLVLAAAALTVGVIFDGGEAAVPEILGFSRSTNVASVFLAGVATALVFLLGLWMMKRTAARARKRRVERKQLKHEQQDSVRGLEEERSSLRVENERMAKELEQRRVAAESSTAARSGEGKATDGASGYTENRTPVGEQSKASDKS